MSKRVRRAAYIIGAAVAFLLTAAPGAAGWR